MTTLTHDRLTRSFFTEKEPHHFTGFASDLEETRQVGRWPTAIQTSIGNGQDLILVAVERNDEGDIQAVRYRQALGCIRLTIFND